MTIQELFFSGRFICAQCCGDRPMLAFWEHPFPMALSMPPFPGVSRLSGLATTTIPEGEAIGEVSAIIVLGLAVITLGLLIWSLVWAYTDAERRGKSGCLVVLLIVLSSWPISLLLWLVSRPD